MTIIKMKLKFLGKTGYIFRVFKDGELVGCFDSEAEAQSFAAAK